MIYTEFKSLEEIAFSLKGKKRVALLSCGTCSNLMDTGGKAGLKTMLGVLNSLGKDVVFSRIVAALCPESIVRETLRSNKRKLRNCDAIVVLSCSSGVKTACIHSKGMPVIAALDTTGTGPISLEDDPRARSVCRSCGTCVITFTDGICPYTGCALKSKYGPCKHYIEGEQKCQVDRERSCVWHEIEKRADISLLHDLKLIHRSNETTFPQYARGETPSYIVSIIGFIAAHSGFVHLIIRSLAKKVE